MKQDWAEDARVFFTANGTVTGQYRKEYNSYTDANSWYPTKYTLNGKRSEIDWDISIGMYMTVVNLYFKDSYLYTYNLRSLLSELNVGYDVQKNCGAHRRTL